MPLIFSEHVTSLAARSDIPAPLATPVATHEKSPLIAGFFHFVCLGRLTSS